MALYGVETYVEGIRPPHKAHAAHHQLRPLKSVVEDVPSLACDKLPFLL
jgi:hypothetical protein